jgi:type I restriction enzyme, R subunit
VSPTGTNEAFSRVKIDAQLKDQGWGVQNPNSVRLEYPLPDGTRAYYVLCGRNGRSLPINSADCTRFSTEREA